jgi:hypothetical protein
MGIYFFVLFSPDAGMTLRKTQHVVEKKTYLFVFWVPRTNDIQSSFAFYQTASVTHYFDGGADFHAPGLFYARSYAYSGGQERSQVMPCILAGQQKASRCKEGQHYLATRAGYILYVSIRLSAIGYFLASRYVQVSSLWLSAPQRHHVLVENKLFCYLYAPFLHLQLRVSLHRLVPLFQTTEHLCD